MAPRPKSGLDADPDDDGSGDEGYHDKLASTVTEMHSCQGRCIVPLTKHWLQLTRGQKSASCVLGHTNSVPNI